MNDRNSPVSEDELNAYVDGELPADRRAAVDAWLAAHPEDAARVREWQAMAEQIRSHYGPVADEPVPARLQLDRLDRLDRRWTKLAAAAIVAAFLLGGLGGWFGRGAVAPASPAIGTVTADALQAYRLYAVEVRHPVEVPGSEAAHLVQWLSKRVGHALRAPDLDAQGLKLVGGRLLPGPTGQPAAFFMYESPTGERFTIYCVKSKAPESALRYAAHEGVAAFYWVDNDLAYVVSGSADRNRLQTITEATYKQLDRWNKRPS